MYLSEFPEIRQQNKRGHCNPSECVKKLVSMVLGPFKMVLFPEPPLRAWSFIAFLFAFNRYRARIAEGAGFSHAAERNSKRRTVGSFT
jgi:hypothetical protein